MFVIHALNDNVTKISIIGGIGTSLKGKANTIQDVQSQLSDIEGDVEAEIASLGGNFKEGLLIHQALKNVKGNLTTKITGATASAGTYPFLAGNKRKIASNARFLIHEVRTPLVKGTAKQLREVVEDLEYADEIQAELYLPFCEPKGKTLEDVKQLMAEERWILPPEAIEWGFATEIVEDYAIAAEYTPELIQAAGLPELPQNYYINMENEKTAVDAFLAKIGLQKIQAVATVETLTAENELLKKQVSELSAKVTELETSTETEKETIIEASKTSITEIEAKYSDIKAELETTKVELAKLKTTAIEASASGDPDPSGEEGKPTFTNPFPVSENVKYLFEQAKYYEKNK